MSSDVALFACGLLLLLGAATPGPAVAAGVPYPGQVKDGEAGYKMGCSAAAAMKIPSCGELPSGKQFVAPPAKGNSKRATQ